MFWFCGLQVLIMLFMVLICLIPYAINNILLPKQDGSEERPLVVVTDGETDINKRD
jgi:hypothetical protein